MNIKKENIIKNIDYKIVFNILKTSVYMNLFYMNRDKHFYLHCSCKNTYIIYK